MTREEIVNKLLEGGMLLPVMTEFEAREVVNYVVDNYYHQAQVVQPDYTYNSKEFLEKRLTELHKEVEVLKKEQPQGLDEADIKPLEKEKSEIQTIPQGLDEAAEESMMAAIERFYDVVGKPRALVNEREVSDFAEELFKAGVKWVAEQGILNC